MWEYKTVHYSALQAEEIDRIINLLGKQCWELTSATESTFYFKRKIG